MLTYEDIVSDFTQTLGVLWERGEELLVESLAYYVYQKGAELAERTATTRFMGYG